MSLTGTEKAMLRVELDMKRFNKWHGKFIRTGWVYYGDALRRNALDLMGKIMNDWPVKTGRSRMGWSGLHKNEGKYIVSKGGFKGKPVKSQVSGDMVSPAVARQEGRDLAHAKDNRKHPTTPHFLIYNPVNYVAYIEARENVISRQLRHFYKHFARDIVRGAERANAKAHREL